MRSLAGGCEPGGRQAALDVAQVVDVPATAALPSVPGELGEPQRAVHEPAPASRLGHADRDPLVGQRDRTLEEALDVAIAADDPIEDDPVAGLGIGLCGVPDLEGRRLGEAGIVGALAGEVDARRRQVNARQARRAHLEERDSKRRRPAAELEHARPAQGRVAEQVENRAGHIHELREALVLRPAVIARVELAGDARVGGPWAAVGVGSGCHRPRIGLTSTVRRGPGR